jgi:hypothetical protein
VAAAKKMDVKMIDGLAAIGAGADHYTIAFGKLLLAGDFGGGPEKMTEQRAIAGDCLGERGDMFARDDEDVCWSLRIYVQEGVALVVLIDAGGGDGSFHDLAKEAAHGEISVYECESGQFAH